MILLSMARCQAKLGRKKAAIRSLKEAVEVSPKARGQIAREDTFRLVRDDPSFKELVK